MKLRQGDPWMPGHQYAALMPPLSLNLLVNDVTRAVQFYQQVLGAQVHYHDPDFAAIRVGPAEIMLHADHTHEHHPWHPALASGSARGLGAQIRLLGLNPDEVERCARDFGAVIVESATDKAHGWRETLVRDPDGYEWAVGVLSGAAMMTQHPKEK
ncbi:MAG: VOC family protein [Chloroflexi bacterium]|nr:VOC family protein [Chloroflexota bacterium]